MQRSYPLRWLALAVGLLGTQCLDSISDDCTKTLTCDEQPPRLGPDCVWRYSDGREWTEGPQYDTATRTWRWPDGKETATQDLQCNLIDAGVDAGTGADCRLGTPCDLPLVCDFGTGVCVECIDDSACSGNMPVGDAGAATVCDIQRHECVRCTSDENCSGDTPICKADLIDSSNNECVECTGDTNCGGAAPVCDETTNECTTSCTTQAECAGSDKPVCNVTKAVCVECENDSTCSGTKTQCNIPDNECVECVDDGPCSGSGEVCDIGLHSCVQCTSDVQCENGPNALTAPFCDTESRTCVTCLNDTQCTDDANSRCNPVSHLCTGCNDAAQCEDGQLCRGGTCVECQDGSQCTAGGEPFCETVSGSCVECLDSAACLAQDAAHCVTEQGAGERFTCTGCVDNPDCAGKPGIGGLCGTGGLCVFCLTEAECVGDRTTSQCVPTGPERGTCATCTTNEHCNLFNGQQGRPLLPACKVGEGCVGCVDNGDCEGNEDGAICKTSNVGAAQGSAAVNTCVECVSNNDCTSPGRSVCSNNACVPCTQGQDGQCGHLAGLNVCNAGTCVECSAANRTACDGNVCNGTTKTCSEFEPRSAALCGECVADEQCDASARCVRQIFDGQTRGFFCFPLVVGTPADCAGPRLFLEPVTGATVDSQQPPPTVCQLRATTCEGFADYGSPGCDNDTDCGADGVNDGICDDDLGGCTIACSSDFDCTGECDQLNGTCAL